jgi:putative transposase
MQASDIKRLRELEEENRRLKQISADLLLENRALKDVIAKSSEASREACAGGGFANRAWVE